MFTRSVLLVLLLLGCLQSITSAQNAKGPKSCCFGYFTRQIHMKFVKEYEETMPGCTKSGIIFTLKNGRRLCVDPGEGWVRKVVDKIDQRLVESSTKSQPSG